MEGNWDAYGFRPRNSHTYFHVTFAPQRGAWSAELAGKCSRAG